MKRYFRYIFLTLILGIMAMSCVEEMDVPQPKPGNDAVTLVPRVKSFSNQYVTKSDYSTAETKITKLAVLVFDSNTEPKLVHIEEASGENITSLRLNKSLLNKCDVTKATIVMIANVDLANVTNSGETSIKDAYADTDTTLELDDLNDYSFHFTEGQTVVASLGDGFNGFPMIGISGPLDLSSSVDHSTGLQVNLQILYAKVNFSISVAPGTENQNYTGVTPSFTLTGYSVHNVSKTTPYTQPTGATVSTDYAYTGEDAFVENTGGTTELNGDAVSFTFYVAESRYAHNSTLEGVYPDDSWLTTTHYDDLKQQYKPKIANLETGTPSAGLATYVTVSGTYKDYRGTNWTVDYKVYLGKDNSQNFEVDRNSEYTNRLTIKGIRNNDSYSDNAQSVWVDHRVNVSTGDLAGNVTITRETLIDSHFEVRPLRVKVPENTIALLFLPRYNGTQIVETENGEGENWIAIENNNGRVKDITQFSPNGKRKYFTTSLIKQLHLENNDDRYGIKVNNNTKDTQRKGERCIQLMTDDDGKDPCVWIYIDQNISESDREAEIELVFYDNEGNETASETFNIIQSGLENVGGLLIEKYEEYLHTYDSQDLYTNPLTDYTQQGYKWGLNEISLSKNQNVVLVGNSSNTRYYYDYFHAYDKQYATPAIGTYEVVGGDISKNSGLNFTHNVVMVKDGMTIIDMSTRPESAIQYCLSKNKFKVDESDKEQHTMDIHWYLPDVYEMADILSAGQNTFPDFAEYAYWTSQPAWTSALAGAYLIEDTENARSVSLDALSDNYTGSTVSRNTQQRIRCAYSETGLSGVSFAGDRAPEGIGAMRFYMRAWKDWDSKEIGYFNWLPQSDDDGGVETVYQLPDTYAYPKVAADADDYFGPYVSGYGFTKDPSSESNWGVQEVLGYRTSEILKKWQGLTTEQIVDRTLSIPVVGDVEYSTLEGKKEESRGTTTTYYTGYSGDIITETLKHLDHTHDNGTDLSITFAKGSDATNAPTYIYYKKDKIVSTTTTRTWQVPKYTPKSNPNEFQDYTLETSEYSYRNSTAAQNAGDTAKSKYSEYSNVTVKTERGGLTELFRYRYVITYRDYKKYYLYNSGGNWVETDNGTQTTPQNNAPTDRLLMYGGNSFTIKANNGNVISSVKIYFSDSNIVDERGGTRDYLRFTVSYNDQNKYPGWNGYTGETDVPPPGMSYSTNGETGTMTWSGDPVNEITFKLVVHREVYEGGLFSWLGSPDSFQYVNNTNDSTNMIGQLVLGSKNHNIVIDQIDVRYKKAETTNQ